MLIPHRSVSFMHKFIHSFFISLRVAFLSLSLSALLIRLMSAEKEEKKDVNLFMFTGTRRKGAGDLC
jgi:hypothetical protein